MATVNFPLTMKDGTKVHTLEELREHGDPESIIAAFRNGKLAQWLDSLFYEDEADRISRIDANAGNWRQQVFNILGIKLNASDELDEEAIARLNEKKRKLGQRTPKQDIIANADHTALNQDDLAELLHRGVSKIYLAADPERNVTYRIPLRQKNKTYVGVIGTPEVEIKADSLDELEQNGIAFENVKLPSHLRHQPHRVNAGTKTCASCGEEISASATICDYCGQNPDATSRTRHTASSSRAGHVSLAQLKALFSSLFNSASDAQSYGDIIVDDFKRYGFEPHDEEGKRLLDEYKRIVDSSSIGTLNKDDNLSGTWSSPEIDDSKMDSAKKSLALQLVCQGKCAERDLVHLRVMPDMSEGWAFTNKGFCWYKAGHKAAEIPYESIKYARWYDCDEDKIQTNAYNEAILRTNKDYGVEDTEHLPGFIKIFYEANGNQRTLQAEGETLLGLSHKMVTYLKSVGDLNGLQWDGSAESYERSKSFLRQQLPNLEHKLWSTSLFGLPHD